MSHWYRSSLLAASLLALACDAESGVAVDEGTTPLFAAAGVGSHHAIRLTSYTGYTGTGLVNVSVTASDPGPTDQGFTVQGEFTLHGAKPNRRYFIARKADFVPPVLDCMTVPNWSAFVEWQNATTPIIPTVFTILSTSKGGAGAAHFYVRSTSPLLADGSVFSVRFAILEDSNGSGTPDAGDTEAYVTDGCLTVRVK